jgi:hypothetical protein
VAPPELSEALGEADGDGLGAGGELGGVGDGVTHRADSGVGEGGVEVLGVTVASGLGGGDSCGQFGPGLGTGGTSDEPGDGVIVTVRLEGLAPGRRPTGSGGCSTRAVGAALRGENSPDGIVRWLPPSASSASTPPATA